MMTPDTAIRIVKDCLDNPEPGKHVTVVQGGKMVSTKPGFVDAVRALVAGYEANECYKDTLIQKFFDLEQQHDRFMRECPKHEELHRTKRNTYIDAGFWAKRLWCGHEPGGEG